MNDHSIYGTGRNGREAMLTLSADVRETLGRTSAEVHRSLTQPARFLVALNAKARRTDSPIFAGVGLAKRAKRRAAGRIAKASRKRNRAA